MKKTYPRNFDQIARIVDDTARFFAQHNIDSSLRMKVDLSIEELDLLRETVDLLIEHVERIKTRRVSTQDVTDPGGQQRPEDQT